MTFSGRVIHGEARGRILGFPTVNIVLEKEGESGVWMGKVFVCSEKERKGTEHDAAIFIHPGRKLLEAHLLDFSGDLYDRFVEVELGNKIREAERFDSEDALKKQIAADIEKIRGMCRLKN